MRLIRFLPWWSTTIILCLVLAWQFRTDILSYGIDRYINTHNPGKITYQLEAIDFSGAVIRELEFQIVHNNRAWNFKLSDVVLSYNIEKLLAGRMNQIHVENASMNAVSAETETKGQIRISSLIESIQSLVSQEILVTNLTINNLVIANNGVSLHAEKPLNLSVESRPTENQIDVLAQLHKSVLKLTKTKNHIFTKLIDKDKSIILSSGYKFANMSAKAPQTIEATLSLDLNKLDRWWQSIFSSTFTGLEGQIVAKITGHKSETQWDLNLTGGIKQLVGSSFATPQSDFDLDFVIPNELFSDNQTITINPGSKIGFDTVRFQGLTFNGLSLFPEGEIGTPEIPINGIIRLHGNARLATTREISINDSEFDFNFNFQSSIGHDEQPIVQRVILNPESKLIFSHARLLGFTLDRLALSAVGAIVISNDSLEFNLTNGSQLSVEALNDEKINVTQVKFIPNISFSSKGNLSRLQLRSGTTFSSKELVFDGTRLDQLDIVLQTTSNLEVNTASAVPNWLLEQGQWNISLPELDFGDYLLRPEMLLLNINQVSPKHLSISLKTDQLNLVAPKNVIELQTINADIELDNTNLVATGGFRVSKLPSLIDYRIEHDMDKAAGNYALVQQIPINIYDNSANLNQLIESWLPQIGSQTRLDNGLINIDLSGAWQKPNEMHHQAQLTVKDAGGSYAGIDFSGLSVMGPIYFPAKNDSENMLVAIESIKYGTEIKNIEFALRLENMDTGSSTGSTDAETSPGISVSYLSGEALGSKFNTPAFKYHSDANINHIDLSVEGLDIDKVVYMQQLEGLRATGKLDGTLPIDISAEGIKIELGQFWNQEPGGTIVYKIDPKQAAALNNPLTETVVKALQEFNYDVLTASTNLEHDGNTSINFHIEGKSPMLETTRPVHLNINSELNVLSLLRSLKYSDSLNSGLDKQLQKLILSNENKQDGQGN